MFNWLGKIRLQSWNMIHMTWKHGLKRNNFDVPWCQILEYEAKLLLRMISTRGSKFERVFGHILARFLCRFCASGQKFNKVHTCVGVSYNLTRLWILWRCHAVRCWHRYGMRLYVIRNADRFLFVAIDSRTATNRTYFVRVIEMVCWKTRVFSLNLGCFEGIMVLVNLSNFMLDDWRIWYKKLKIFPRNAISTLVFFFLLLK